MQRCILDETHALPASQDFACEQYAALTLQTDGMIVFAALFLAEDRAYWQLHAERDAVCTAVLLKRYDDCILLVRVADDMRIVAVVNAILAMLIQAKGDAGFFEQHDLNGLLYRMTDGIDHLLCDDSSYRYVANSGIANAENGKGKALYFHKRAFLVSEW